MKQANKSLTSLHFYQNLNENNAAETIRVPSVLAMLFTPVCQAYYIHEAYNYWEVLQFQTCIYTIIISEPFSCTGMLKQSRKHTVFSPSGARRASWSNVRHSPPALIILALAVSVNLSAVTFIAGISWILLSSVTVPTITAMFFSSCNHKQHYFSTIICLNMCYHINVHQL